MTFDLHIHFDDQSPEGLALEALVSRYGVSPEEVLKRGVTQLLAAEVAPDNYDHIFTPAVIAELDSISAEIKAGGTTYTGEEIDEYFVQKKQAWLANHPA